MSTQGEPVSVDLSAHAEEIREQAGYFRLVYDTGRRYVNDHCFVLRDGALHLLHITGAAGGGPYDAGNEVTFGHASIVR